MSRATPGARNFFTMGSEICRDCKTATEAAQALNRDLFNRVNVHYNLARKRNNQSPKESIEQSKATCTGLSIILVDACRAVGIPARIVGVPQWANKEGNHTWVEIWDGEWFFMGADEYDKLGLNRGWFVADAANTAPQHQSHQSGFCVELAAHRRLLSTGVGTRAQRCTGRECVRAVRGRWWRTQIPPGGW